MSIKISQLPTAISLSNTTIFPLVQNSETESANLILIGSFIANNFSTYPGVTSDGNLGLIINGSEQIQGNIEVNGNSSTFNTTTFHINSPANISGELTVDDDTLISGNISVLGANSVIANLLLQNYLYTNIGGPIHPYATGDLFDVSWTNDSNIPNGATITYSTNQGAWIPNPTQGGVANITSPANSSIINYSNTFTGNTAPTVITTAVGSDPTSLNGIWITNQGSSGAWTGFTLNCNTAPSNIAIFNYLAIDTGF